MSVAPKKHDTHEILIIDPSAVSDYLYLFDSKTFEYTRVDDYEQSQGAGPRFGHSGWFSVIT